MNPIKAAAIAMAGNQFVQRLLERNVRISQHLMGIGTGAGALSSGERVVFQVLQRKTRLPYCIFDVGANQGQFLQLTLNNIGAKDHSIHCFEPGHETFRLLAESSKATARVTLNNIGIGKEKGEAELHYNVAGSGLASLTKRNLDHLGIEFRKAETVKIDTIDNYCMEHAIRHINLLKIDIEGHELDALTGARRMFSAKAIDIVTFEFGGCNIDTRTYFQDFWRFFKEVDFSLFRITPAGGLYPIRSYRESLEQFRTTNFLALANAGDPGTGRLV